MLWDMAATIAKVRSKRRSYYVENEAGRLYLRNRKYLKRRVTESGDEECAALDKVADTAWEPRRSARLAGKKGKQVSFGGATTFQYEPGESEVPKDVRPQEEHDRARRG
jgi:hypothetical protein